MLALRLGEGSYEPELPLSARIRADIGPDGVPHMVDGRILVDKGFIGRYRRSACAIPIDRAEINLEWDATRQALVDAVPDRVGRQSRLTLLAQRSAATKPAGCGSCRVSGGTVVLGPAAGESGHARAQPNPAASCGSIPAARRVDIEQGEIGNADLGVALSGSIDYSSDDPRLAVGIAGTRMSVAALKRLWPVFVAPKVRAWVEEHVAGGTIERIDDRHQCADVDTCKIERPADSRRRTRGRDCRARRRNPPGRTACRRSAMPTSSVRVTGRTATIDVGRGNVEISPGRKLVDHQRRVRGAGYLPEGAAGDGPFPARRSGAGGRRTAVARTAARALPASPLDPATSRGTLAAQVTLGMPLKADLPPGSSTYTHRRRRHELRRRTHGDGPEGRGRRAARSVPTTRAIEIRGDVKVNGMPADARLSQAADERRCRSARSQATLDEAARAQARLRSWRARRPARCRSRSTAEYRSNERATAAARSRPT